MNFTYEASDNLGNRVQGSIDADTFVEAHRKLYDSGYTPFSLMPTRPAPAPNVDATIIGGLSVLQRAGASSVSTTATASSASLRSSSSGSISNSNSKLVATVEPSGMFSRNELSAATMRPPIAVKPPPPVIHRKSELSGAKPKDLLLFFQMLAPLVKSGMTIHTALDNVAGRCRNSAIATAAHEMARTARTGGRVSDAMERYPNIFPENVVGTVRAGEVGGFLEIVLAEVALNYEQNIALYQGSWKWKAWVVQSLFTLALILPLFSSLFSTMDMAENIRIYLQREAIILPLFGLFCLGGIALVRTFQRPEKKRTRDQMALRIPVVGRLQRQSALSAFVRMLRKLYHAGVGPIQAWEAAMYTADNVIIREDLARAYQLVERGSSIADAFAASGLFADDVEQLLITGQLSGDMVESLDKAAQIYQDRVQQAHEETRIFMMRAARITMIALMGISVAWMMKSYFAGIFSWVDRYFSADG